MLYTMQGLIWITTKYVCALNEGIVNNCMYFIISKLNSSSGSYELNLLLFLPKQLS